MKTRTALLAVVLAIGSTSAVQAFCYNPNGPYVQSVRATYAPYPSLQGVFNNWVAAVNTINKNYTDQYNLYVVYYATRVYGTTASPNYPAAVKIVVQAFGGFYPPAATVSGPGGFSSPGSPYAPFTILGPSYSAGGRFYVN